MADSKLIVITGVSSELGSVLASELAKEPHVRIIGTMRRALRAGDEFPENVSVVDECDLTIRECCVGLAKHVDAKSQGPFGFVHCVGDFWDHVPFLEFGSEQARKLFASHVDTLYNALQALVPLMQAKGGGSSIAFSCNSITYNYPYMASFTASKSAVNSLVRSLANELSGHHLRFNSVVLASLQTSKVREAKPRGDFAHYIPPTDIVPIVRFLLSDESYLVNGSCLNLFVHSNQFYNLGYFQRISK
jgi:NAD(P)-dependent dehydrogenase (short-subunit alcohol dehydrogenase family)